MRGKQRFFTGAAAAAALILVLGAVSPPKAQVPAAFVDIGYGARPMGMGGAFTALSDDAHAIFWNPAGLAGLSRSELTLMHTKQLGLIPYTMLAYAGRLGTWGAGLGVLSSGNDVLRETTILFSFARSVRLPLLGMSALG
ncbi:MAG TPA: hypothetical protein ENJ23_01370, partial [Bacteroidetes bacterium]|nr:hypothetical protein [Bacteroidota bacterium]